LLRGLLKESACARKIKLPTGAKWTMKATVKYGKISVVPWNAFTGTLVFESTQTLHMPFIVIENHFNFII